MASHTYLNRTDKTALMVNIHVNYTKYLIAIIYDINNVLKINDDENYEKYIKNRITGVILTIWITIDALIWTLIKHSWFFVTALWDALIVYIVIQIYLQRLLMKNYIDFTVETTSL